MDKRMDEFGIKWGERVPGPVEMRYFIRELVRECMEKYNDI